MRYRTLAVILLGHSVCPEPAHAQGRLAAISGVVQSESGAALNDVEVALDPAQGPSRSKRTDDEGRFLFGLLKPGSYTIRFRRLGYFPEERELTLAGASVTLPIVLKRVPTALDTIRVRGHQAGIFGIVAARENLRPLDAAEVRILRTRTGTTTHSDGRFELLEGVKPGAQVLFGQAKGFASSMLSVTVPESSTIEVALVLKSSSAPGVRRVAMPMAELEERAHWMGRGAALVSAAELAEFRGMTLDIALVQVMSLRKRGILVGGGCTLVNGWQRGRSTGEFDVDQVEAVEIYLAGTDYTGTLADRGCPSSAAMPRQTSQPFSRPRRNVAGFATVVVWLKR